MIVALFPKVQRVRIGNLDDNPGTVGVAASRFVNGEVMDSNGLDDVF